MNVKGYGAAYEKAKELLKSSAGLYTNESQHKYRDLVKRMKERALPEHEPRASGEFMSDWIVCSCGWESKHYWDGMEFAMDEWYDHVYEEAAGLKPKECKCGKEYVEAYGGKPCHELVEVK